MITDADLRVLQLLRARLKARVAGVAVALSPQRTRAVRPPWLPSAPIERPRGLWLGTKNGHPSR